MSDTLKVFVYGTLKVGGFFSKRFDDYRLSSKEATTKGTMFDSGSSYPAVVLEGDDTITGEVHEYSNKSEVELRMDYIEGFGGSNDSPGNLYNKYEITVNTKDGSEKCIMYGFARDTNELKKVESGIWEI